MRVKSPEEMAKALENCAKLGPCTNCPYGETLLCTREIGRDAAETILMLLRAFKAIPNAMNVDAGIIINPGSTATDTDLEDTVDFFLPRKDHPDNEGSTAV